MTKYFTRFCYLFILIITSVSAHAVTASFTSDVTSGCAPLTVNFTNTSVDATSYSWNFQNGNPPSTQTNASATFLTPGTYNVTLTAYNGSASSTATATITVYGPPIVAFSGSPTSLCAPGTVSFVDQSTLNAPGAATYQWSFGTGSPGSGSATSYTFNNPGSYNINLTVTNGAGCVASLTKPAYVTIYGPPAGDFSASPTTLCGSNPTTTFTNNSSGPTPLSYSWNFGDNTPNSTVTSPTHTYAGSGPYTVQLIVTDGIGCKDTVTKNNYISVVNVPASFTGSTSVCVGETASFTNTSSVSSSSSWDFGDGSPNGFGTTTTHAYATSGTYTVTLSNSSGGCTQTTTHTIMVNGMPSTAFTINPAEPCPAPIAITFNPTQTGNTYQWFFGDNSPSVTTANPTHTYNSNGRYDIEVIATSGAGCKDTTLFHNYLTIYPLLLSVNDDVRGGCIPFPVQFNANAYYEAPLASFVSPYPYGIASYQWSFGDSPLSTSTLDSPVHTYTAYGTYTVKLTATTNNGCVVTDSTVIRAGTPDTANFSASPLTACVKQPIEFSNMSSGATNYYWYFGDGGQTTDVTPEYKYQVPGTYNVRLVAIKNGCPDTMVKNNYITIFYPKAQYGVSFDCSATRVVHFDNESLGVNTYSWDFGDGNTTTTTFSPTHTYAANGNYTVVLTVHNDTSSCMDTGVYHMVISTPVASITTPDTAICVNDSASFTAHLGGGGYVLDSSRDYSWYWQSRSDTDTVNTITYTFNTVEQTQVMVVIDDYRGCKDTARSTMVIAKPTVNFTGIPTPVCSPLPVNFTDQSTDAPTTSFTSRIWTYGDNNTTTGNNATPNHGYTAAGTYNVKLVVTDNVGCTDSLTKVSYITVNKPHADFTVSTVNACKNRLVTFTSTASGTSLSYYWSFGDGYISTLQNPVHQYAQLGTFTVKLVVTDNIGCMDSSIKTSYITVYDDPVASFVVSDTFSICSPLIDTFYSTATGATSYQWDFGDGNSSSLDTAINPYTSPGLYNVSLIVTNTHGCIDTAYHTVQVLGYAGLLTYTPIAGCAPLTVNFTANINNINVPSFVYDFSDGTTTTTSSTTTTHTYTMPGPHVPRLILTSSTGCQSSSLGLDTIRVDGLFQGFTYQPNPLCGSDTVTFTDTSHGAYSSLATSSWYFDNGQSSNTAVATHYYPSPASYPVTLVSTTTTGCVDTLRANMTVYPLPDIYAGIDTTICLGDSAYLQPSGGVSYVWAPASFLSCSACTNPSAFPATQTVYTVTGTDVHGCSNTDSLIVSIKTKTTGNVDTAGTSICRLQSVQLHAYATSSVAHFTWLPATGLDNSVVADPVANPDTTTNYMVIIQEGSCIPDTDYVRVTVYPLPEVSINPDVYKIIAGDSVMLEVSGSGIQNYVWTPSEGLSCDSCEAPVATPKSTTNYVLTVYSQYGCVDSAHARIEVVCDHSQVYMPNTFTPNGDGANDIFYPRGKGLQTIKSFRIYDRWGELVFEKRNFNLNEKDNGWDGTYKGTKLNADVYVYVVDAICDTGSPITWTGDIALLR